MNTKFDLFIFDTYNLCFIIDNKIKEDKNQLGLENSPSNIYHICGLMPEDKASLAKIDEYIEMLYDDMPKKVRGSGFILKVTSDKDNLEELSSSGIIIIIIYSK